MVWCHLIIFHFLVWPGLSEGLPQIAKPKRRRVQSFAGTTATAFQTEGCSWLVFLGKHRHCQATPYLLGIFTRQQGRHNQKRIIEQIVIKLINILIKIDKFKGFYQVI